MSSINVLAQAPEQYQLYGSYADLDGRVIHDYADQDYAPTKSVNIFFNTAVFGTSGHYYTSSGAVEAGRIHFPSGYRFFNYAENEAATSRRVRPEQGWSFTIGADSFIVAGGFTVYGKLGVIEQDSKDANILSYIGKSQKFAFFNYEPSMGVKANYLVRDLKSEKYISLPLTSKAFREEAAEIFKAYPLLVGLLQNGEIKSNQVPDIIRFIQYSDALAANKAIGYTANWDITDNPKKQVYYAEVSKPAEDWRLDFYNQAGHKLFTEHYTYAQPTKNNGEALWYYPSTGEIRKKTKFVMGESSRVFFIFHPNGKLHYHYYINNLDKIVYRYVQSENGESVLDITGSGKEEFFDETSKRTIGREFQNNALLASYFVDQQGRKVYQYAQRNAKIVSLNTYNKDLSTQKMYPLNALKAGEEGVVLVKFIIAPKDQVESFSILQGVSPDIDQKVLSLLKSNFSAPSFKSGKHGKQEVYQEVVVPFRFALIRESINRYHYHNPFWMHQFNNPAFAPPIPAPPVMPR